MCQLHNTDGFALQGWMVNELGLDIAQLFTFALVHQFTMSKAGIYTGNTAYLSAWTGWSQMTAKKHLNALEERGLIVSIHGRENNVPFCHYKLGPAFLDYVKSTTKNFGSDPQNFAIPLPKNLGVINNIDNKEKHPYKYGCKKDDADTKKYVCDNPPSVDDVYNYVKDYDIQDPRGFAEHYVTEQTERGWTYGKNNTPLQNWKTNVLHWIPNYRTTIFPRKGAAVPAPASGPRQMTSAEIDKLYK